MVAAGSHDTFEIFVWSMQTGRLLEVYTHAHAHVQACILCLYYFLTFTSPSLFSSLPLSPSLFIFISFLPLLSSLSLSQILTGHEGPVSGLSFSPSRSILTSSSWDKTVKLWDVFESKGNIETLPHTTDGKLKFCSF